jgi:hypothetical protein
MGLVEVVGGKGRGVYSSPSFTSLDSTLFCDCQCCA